LEFRRPENFNGRIREFVAQMERKRGSATRNSVDCKRLQKGQTTPAEIKWSLASFDFACSFGASPEAPAFGSLMADLREPLQSRPPFAPLMATFTQ
jgi:hypothetical protein